MNDDTLIRDADPTEAESLYCGNCGVDYSEMTVGDLAALVARRPCPACRQYLTEMREGA